VVDETYLKVRGRWCILYVPSTGNGDTVDFRLSPTRDVAAAKAFFRKALRTHNAHRVSITLDGYAASHRAVREMPKEDQAWKNTQLRSSKYLNNLIEQDHRGIKSRTGPMLASRTLIAQLPPSPVSNCSTVFAKDNLTWGVLHFKNQTVPAILECGTRRVVVYSSTGLVAPLTRYLHQSPF